MSEQGGRDEAIQHDVHHGGRRTLEGDVVADRGPGVPASNPSGVNPSVSSARAEQKFPIAQACPECGKPIQIQRHDGIVYVEGRSAPAAIDSLMDRASDVPDGRSQGGRQAAPVVGGGSVASASDPAPYVFAPDTNALGNLGARTWEVEEARAESSEDGEGLGRKQTEVAAATRSASESVSRTGPVARQSLPPLAGGSSPATFSVDDASAAIERLRQEVAITPPDGDDPDFRRDVLTVCRVAESSLHSASPGLTENEWDQLRFLLVHLDSDRSLRIRSDFPWPSVASLLLAVREWEAGTR